MRELSDRVTSVLDGLTIPPEREMPREVMAAQKQALLSAIVVEASREPASLSERIQLRLRTILGLFDVGRRVGAGCGLHRDDRKRWLVEARR
jgi:hypothetical protein